MGPEALVVVVVGGEHDIRVRCGQRPPERRIVPVGAVHARAQAWVVQVGERAAGACSQNTREPALLRRTCSQPPAGRQLELSTTTSHEPRS